MSTEMKPWQQGVPMETLKPLAEVFKREYKPYIFGAFGLPKERDIATAIAEKKAIYTRELSTCLLFHYYSTSGSFTDFTGAKHSIPAGDVCVKDLVGLEKSRAFEALFTRASGANIWAECFQENEEMKSFYLKRGFRLRAVKISAASEIIGVYYLGKEQGGAAYSLEDEIGIKELVSGFISPAERESILGEVKAFNSWADHYSSYNKGNTWQAFSLRGFDASDPFFIEKPAEMSRKWKEDNAHRLSVPCSDTVALEKFPETMKVVAKLPGEKERVRFMKLKANVGELSRHADITDREAGTKDGAIVRLHIPIVTHPEVVFTSWDLSGKEVKLSMPERSLCYIDTRKPHRAKNTSSVDRIHLVVDLRASEDIRKLLRQ